MLETRRKKVSSVMICNLDLIDWKLLFNTSKSFDWLFIIVMLNEEIHPYIFASNVFRTSFLQYYHYVIIISYTYMDYAWAIYLFEWLKYTLFELDSFFHSTLQYIRINCSCLFCFLKNFEWQFKKQCIKCIKSLFGIDAWAFIMTAM